MSQEEANHVESNKRVAFEGVVGEVVHIDMPGDRTFEVYRRPPGTRIIIVSSANKILMTREYRHESGEVDLRLPGGKVFNTMKEMNHFVNAGGNMDEAILDGARAEARQETGMTILDPKVIATAVDGATVEWDLDYVLVTEFEEHADGQQLEAGEEGTETVWMSIEEITEAIQRGEMHEWRSVGVLLGKIFPLLTQT